VWHQAAVNTSLARQLALLTNSCAVLGNASGIELAGGVLAEEAPVYQLSL